MAPEAREEILSNKRLFKTARKETHKLIRRIETHLAAGQTKAALTVQRQLLNSFYAKLIAAEEANKKLRGKQKSTAELIRIARDLDLCTIETELVRLRSIIKDNGKYRIFFAFGIRHKTRQYLCCMALRPFLLPSLRQDQYATAGRGTGKAVTNLKEKIESQEGKFFTELDIENFYPSLGIPNCSRPNDTDVMAWLPLPQRVIQTTIIAMHYNIDQSYYRKHSIDISQTLASRRGLPQGSPVSTLIAEYVMAQILNAAEPELPGDVSLTGFADNIAVLGKTRESVERAKKTLKRSVERCSYGSFRLKPAKPISHVGKGFNFLGYNLYSTRAANERRVTITATEKNEASLADKIKKHVKESSKDGLDQRDIKAMATTIRSWCASSSLAPYIRQIAARVAVNQACKMRQTNSLELVFAALEYLYGEDFVAPFRRRRRKVRRCANGLFGSLPFVFRKGYPLVRKHR